MVSSSFLDVVTKLIGFAPLSPIERWVSVSTERTLAILGDPPNTDLSTSHDVRHCGDGETDKAGTESLRQ